MGNVAQIETRTMDRSITSRQIRDLALISGGFLAATFPFLLLWRTPMARGYALMIFFLGLTIAAANYVGRAVELAGDRAADGRSGSGRSWLQTIAPLTAALVLAAAVFSALCWLLSEGVEDPPIAPMLAFMSLVPAIGITPYFVFALRRRFAAVVFAVTLVGAMKLIGCLIVVLIYGWDADEQGRLGLPWHRPDLLVWLFWSLTTMLSVTLYVLAAGRYRTVKGTGTPSVGPPDTNLKSFA
jgi:hypothetical protein